MIGHQPHHDALPSGKNHHHLDVVKTHVAGKPAIDTPKTFVSNESSMSPSSVTNQLQGSIVPTSPACHSKNHTPSPLHSHGENPHVLPKGEATVSSVNMSCSVNGPPTKPPAATHPPQCPAPVVVNHNMPSVHSGDDGPPPVPSPTETISPTYVQNGQTVKKILLKETIPKGKNGVKNSQQKQSPTLRKKKTWDLENKTYTMPKTKDEQRMEKRIEEKRKLITGSSQQQKTLSPIRESSNPSDQPPQIDEDDSQRQASKESRMEEYRPDALLTPCTFGIKPVNSHTHNNPSQKIPYYHSPQNINNHNPIPYHQSPHNNIPTPVPKMQSPQNVIDYNDRVPVLQSVPHNTSGRHAVHNNQQQRQPVQPTQKPVIHNDQRQQHPSSDPSHHTGIKSKPEQPAPSNGIYLINKLNAASLHNYNGGPIVMTNRLSCGLKK